MERRRLVARVALLTLLTLVAVATQLTIAPSSAQTTEPKMTGKFSDKIIKSFDASGLPGLHSIQYRHFTASPGAKVENLVFDDHAELCMPRKGSITGTLADGSKHTFKGGDIFTIPLNANFKLLVMDSKLGFDEFYWSINIKERKEM